MLFVAKCLNQERNRTVLRFRECFIDTVSMKVIKVTLVIRKVNMFSEKYPVEIKFNFVSRRQ